MIEDRSPRPIEPETLLSALAEPGRLALYVSNGQGPPPRGWPHEQPEFVRLALLTTTPPATIETALASWQAAGEALVGGALRTFDPAELVLPGAGSRWTAVPAEGRAGLIRQGAELLLSLAPEIAVFHVSDEFGEGLLNRVQAALATGEGLLDVRLLEHLFYATLTYRLLVHAGEAVVVAETLEPTWSLRQVFPEHASVWQRSLARAPAERVGGLSFASLAERIVWATATRRGRAELSGGAPAIGSAVEAAARSLRPRLSNLLRERPGGGAS